jgi:hypothetical protein
MELSAVEASFLRYAYISSVGGRRKIFGLKYKVIGVLTVKYDVMKKREHIMARLTEELEHTRPRN